MYTPAPRVRHAHEGYSVHVRAKRALMRKPAFASVADTQAFVCVRACVCVCVRERERERERERDLLLASGSYTVINARLPSLVVRLMTAMRSQSRGP